MQRERFTTDLLGNTIGTLKTLLKSGDNSGVVNFTISYWRPLSRRFLICLNWDIWGERIKGTVE